MIVRYGLWPTNDLLAVGGGQRPIPEMRLHQDACRRLLRREGRSVKGLARRDEHPVPGISVVQVCAAHASLIRPSQIGSDAEFSPHSARTRTSGSWVSMVLSN
jgi:hypothetical protein